MGKHLKKQNVRLKVRQKVARAGGVELGIRTGRKLPGSMNSHKSVSRKVKVT
jgi:hypothetical protein